ncbi:hypothetical protein L6303_03075 [archaeon]|nr:hypothetical protein [Nanoarchaeota archaeon]MCG2723700.1 hypothetical protein [archaeon]
MSDMKIINDSEIKDEKIIPCGRLKRHFIEKDLEIDINRIDAGQGTKTHYHKKMTEIYLIINGAGIMKIKDRKTGRSESKNVYSLSSILIPPNHTHQLTNTGKETLVHYVICRPLWREDDELFEDF